MINKASRVSPNETRITASVPKPRLVRLELGAGPVGGWLTVRDRLAVRIPAVGFDPVTMMLKDPIGETGPAEMLSCESKGGCPLDGLRPTFSPLGSCPRERSTRPATPRDRLTDRVRDMLVPWTSDALVWLRDIP